MEKHGDDQNLGQHHSNDEEKAAAKIEEKIVPGHIHTNSQEKAETYSADGGNANACKVVQPLHELSFSLIVTLTCSILCVSMPLVAVFFGPALLIACMLVTVLVYEAKAHPHWIGALKIFSRGRLVAMLVAVGLYPPLSIDQVRFLMVNPLAMVAGDAPPGLPTAFTFAMLCAMQTGIATVLALEAIPRDRLGTFIPFTSNRKANR